MAKPTLKAEEGNNERKFLKTVRKELALIARQRIRDELDPQTDLTKILSRICTLVLRAKVARSEECEPSKSRRGAKSTDPYAVGLEAIERIAFDLRSLRPPFNENTTNVGFLGDMRERHRGACDALTPDPDYLNAHLALKWVSESWVTVGGAEGSTAANAWSDEQTVAAVRPAVTLPAGEISDEMILAAVAEYRKPRCPRGRRRADAKGFSTDKSRALSAFGLVQREAPKDPAREIRVAEEKRQKRLSHIAKAPRGRLKVT